MNRKFLLSLILGVSICGYAQADNSCAPDDDSESSCEWSFDEDTGILTISGSGDMKDYGSGDTPWYSLGNSVKKIVIGDKITSIGDEAFSDSAATSVSIGNSVKSIGYDAFCSSSLTSVKIPDSVTEIGEDAFQDADELTEVIIGNSVTSLGYSVFGYCDSLSSIIIPPSVTLIDDSAFEQCKSLTNVDFPDNPNISIDKYAFWDNNLLSGSGITCGGETCSEEMTEKLKSSIAIMWSNDGYNDYNYITDSSFATVTSTTDANGLTTYTTSDGRVTKTVDSAGVVTRYDANNNVVGTSVVDKYVTAYTVKTATERVQAIDPEHQCDGDLGCSLKIIFK